MSSKDDPTKLTGLGRLTALPGVLHVLLVRSDGLLVARGSAQNAAPEDQGATARVAAMTATALSLNKRIIGAFQGGALTETSVIGTEAKFLLYAAGPRAVLALITTKDADTELISQRARAELGALAAELQDS